MKTLLTLFLAVILTFSASDSYSQKKGKSSKSSSPKTQTVKGYTKRNGTKVKSYKRSPKKTSSIKTADDSRYVVSKGKLELELIERLFGNVKGQGEPPEKIRLP